MKRLLCILLVLCSAAGNAGLLAQDNASYSVRRQRQTSATRQSARKNTDDDQKKTATPARRQTATRQTTNGNKPATAPATTRRTTTSRGAFSLSEAQKTARQTATSPATQSDGNGATAVGPKARQKKETAQKPENESGLQLTVRAQTQYNAQRDILHLLLRFSKHLDKTRKKRNRQIIHTEIPHIFQHLKSSRFSGSGHSRHNH